MNLKEALQILEFGDAKVIPKLKDIQKQFHKLSKLKHPDKNGGTKEATEDFQKLLDAYHVAGKAAEETIAEDSDLEDIIAQKIFRQFQFKSVKVNSLSITIKTEKGLNSSWSEILSKNLGPPVDKGHNGKKFHMVDRCENPPQNVYITLYHTGNMLIQAEGNKQSLNIHFLNSHLQDLFIQVYNCTKQQKKLPNPNLKTKTPLRKPTLRGSKTTPQQINCPKCDFQTTQTGKLAKHRKKHHSETHSEKALVDNESDSPSTSSSGCDDVQENDLRNEKSRNIDASEGEKVINNILELVHKSPNPTKCSLCEHEANNPSELNTHVKARHLKLSIKKSGPLFVIPAPLNVLPITPTTSNPIMFQCFICPEYYNQGDWPHHEKAVHQNKCPKCEKVFTKQVDLDVHIHECHQVTDSQADFEQCPICDNRFATNALLTEHINTSHPKPLNTCDNQLTSPSDVTTHTTQEDSEETNPDDIQTVIEPLSCNLCEFTSKYNKELNRHFDKKHSDQTNPNKVPEANCDLCDYSPTEKKDKENHTKQVHLKKVPGVSLSRVVIHKCPDCTFVCAKGKTLNIHIEKSHKSIKFNCELCPFNTTLRVYLRRHIASTHPKVKCNLCAYTSNSLFSLQVHEDHDHPLAKEPPRKTALFTCKYCDIVFSSSDDLTTHINRRHVAPLDNNNTNTLKLILEEQIDIFTELKKFKESVYLSLSDISTNQDTIRQDIQQLSYSSSLNRSALHSIEEKQAILQEKIVTLSTIPLAPKEAPPILSNKSNTSNSLPSTSPPDPKPPPPPTSPHSSSTTAIPPTNLAQPRQEAPPNHSNRSNPSHTSLPSTSLPDSRSRRPTSPRRPGATVDSTQRIPTSKRSKVLFIADSIGHNVDIRHLEEASNTLIYTEKAYGADYKHTAKYPNKNFVYASNTYTRKQDYKYAILQGLSTDITNLDTSTPNSTNIEYLKQEVYLASQKMITSAQIIINKNPNLEKVVIFDTTPRFDPLSADPLGLKAKLSQYGNTILRHELNICNPQNKISIASHILPTTIQQDIYGDPNRPGYDGIHLYGRNGRNYYTRSVCNVLQNISKDSRELHKHAIPPPPIPPATFSPPSSCPKPSQSHQYTAKTHPTSKPDYTILDIEATPQHSEQYQYPIPTHNMFQTLGNY